MPGKVFISYSSADQEIANKLVLEIQRRGIPCWISSHDILPGEDYQKAIVTAVKDSGVFLLLFSENANKSTDIPHELALAGKYKKTVIPARLQDIVPSDAFAYQMTSSQFIDLFHDFDAKINELCLRLAELLQISEDVAQRMRLENQRRLEEQRRAALQRKLKHAIILCGVALLFIGGGAAWWIFKQHHAAPSALSQGIVPSSNQPPPPVSPSVAENASPPAPSAAIATPAPVVNATPAPSSPPVVYAPPPVVTSPPAVAAVSPPSGPTIIAPAVSSNPVPFASSEASAAQYAQAVKSALAALAPSGPFVAGKYVDSDGHAYIVHGPGVSLPGQTSWSIELNVDPDLNKQYQATWTTGPVKQNPDLANQRHLATLPEGFSYGFARQRNGALALIGARALGSTIEIATFSDNSGWRQINVFTVSPQGN